jgi:hypothetical protein
MPSAQVLGLQGPPLLTGKPNQCLLVFIGDCLTFIAGGGHRVWVDNMYLRQNFPFQRFAQETAVVRVDRPVFGEPLASSPKLWLTNTTLQGTGDENLRGLFVSASVYADGARPHAGAPCML